MKRSAIVTLLVLVVMSFTLPMFAAEDGAALYKAKCAACHGPDGAKQAKANLGSAEIQGKSDADLQKFITGHKVKNLTEEQTKALVTFLRSLKK